ncbi:MAG TPA: TIM-barrel domain-containing protein [Chitinophagales bacterium]|nr:TIM-barrel domain-containing protein [Chitinophagales bacterium]
MKKAVQQILMVTVLLIFAGCKKDKENKYFSGTQTQTTPWPEWIFHHWVWEDEGTTASAKQLVADYQAHGIPVGAIIIDSPWETGYNTFQTDTTLYPDVKGMVDYFHSQNVKVLFWITGIIDTNVHPLYDYADSHNYFMKQSASGGPVVQSWWKGKGSIIDWYNPDAVSWWQGLMDTTLALGIDGWKCDGTDFYCAFAQYSPALGTTIPNKNDYSDRYYRIFHDYTREKLGIDRVIMSRPIDNYGYGDLGGDAFAFTPKNIGWSCWVGDQDATFTGMSKALNNMYQSDLYGYLGFGSDIGGYRTDNNYPATGRSKELFLRWAELGAFCGLMENGGGGEHRPWMFDQQTTDVYKRFVLLREQMVPYLMKTASARYAEGRAMMNFISESDYSYMLGDDVFVTPILQTGGIATVKFPVGSNWVYLFDKGQVHAGGSTQTVILPLNEFPVYIKQGSSLLDTLTPE